MVMSDVTRELYLMQKMAPMQEGNQVVSAWRKD
jgi:hypothetical protein